MTEFIFQVTPLTPIHIGSGEPLDPFEYVVTGQTLYRFTMESLMLALPRPEQETFVQVVGESIPATRQFVSQHAALARQVARWQAAVTGEAEALYHGRLESGQGHPEVLTTMRTGRQIYLPGSSLKGAIRTALLYEAMKKPQAVEAARDLEQAAFGFQQIPEDPFRAFKLGDGRPLNSPSKIRAVRVHTFRQNRWQEDVPLLVETVPGQLSDDVSLASLHPVTFDENFYKLRPRAFRLTPEGILAACRSFYGRHLAEEQAFTARFAPAAAAYNALISLAGSLPPHACLVRLGWGSGRDATTVSYGLAGVKSPTSRRLAEEGWPLGWAELSITTAAGQPLAVAEPVPALPERKRTPTASPEPEKPRPEPPPPPPAAKYPLYTSVMVTVVGQWVKGEVQVRLPEGEKGFWKVSRRQLEQAGQGPLKLVVVRIRNDIYYLELP